MYEIRQVIQRLRLGESQRAVARTQRIGRTTVGSIERMAASQGWLDPAVPMPDDATLAASFKTPRKGSQNVSSVAPFREQVLAWHAQGIQATTIRQALARTHGYTGSLSAIYRFLNREAVVPPPATVMLEFAVGELAQVDFGCGPPIADGPSGESIKTWIFVMTLAWSRHQYAEIVRNQSVETWLACHRHAFEWFNGVPRKIRIDNPKCAITRACYHEPTVQRAYGELALGYRFLIDPCPVRDPAKKGIVEAGVKFIKRSFVPLRVFRDLAHANEQLQAWILGEAGGRVHGSTRERPLERFVQSEQALLQSLPAMAPECPAWVKAKLHGNCHVQFDYCYYSAPFGLVGQTLWLEVAPAAVRLYLGHELVAIHPRLFKPGQRSTVADHLPPDAQAYFMRDPQWCLAQAKTVGPACVALIEALFAHRVVEHLRAAQGVMRLREQFGASRLEAACSRALNFGSPTYRTVKQILKDGLDRQSELLERVELEAPYRGAGRFSRNSSERLH
jgi:transposase